MGLTHDFGQKYEVSFFKTHCNEIMFDDVID